MSSTTSATLALSLTFPSLNTRAISFSKPSSLSINPTPSLSLSFFLQHSSSFARNVALSSEFGQEEDALSGRNERRYSEDRKLFVGNLPFNIDSAQLADLFSNAGNVQVSEVIYDKATGRSRGFGFVTMSSTQEVEAAAQQFNGYELEGRAIRVNSGPAPPKESSFSRTPRGGGESFDGAKRVYVGNLSWNVDNVALETLFSDQGKVLDAKVVYDRESGRSRGFGFVSYGSSQEVDSAIESLNGVEMDGRSIRVSAAESRPPRSQY